MSEGPRHGAIIQSGVPLEFLCDEQEEEAVWKVQIKPGSQILATSTEPWSSIERRISRSAR